MGFVYVYARDASPEKPKSYETGAHVASFVLHTYDQYMVFMMLVHTSL